MTKVINIAPVVIESCRHCPFRGIDWAKSGFLKLRERQFYYCSVHTLRDGTYPELEDIDNIPQWCGLKEYQLEDNYSG